MLEQILKYKNIITTVMGVVQLVVTAVDQYLGTLNGAEPNMLMLFSSICVAVLGYFIGKRPTV